MIEIKKDLSLRNVIKKAGKNQKLMWKSLNKIFSRQKEKRSQ